MDDRPDPRARAKPRCRYCPFAKGGGPVLPVMGSGPLDPVGVMVGEGPGREETERGKVFTGVTGKELDRLLLHVRLQRSKLFIVNAMCCAPTMHKSESDMRKATDCCRPVLIEQLARLKSVPHILAMGKWAAYALTGSTRGIKNGRGFLREWTLEQTLAAHKKFRKKLRAEIRKRNKRKAKK